MVHLSIIVPTIGRGRLPRCLGSIVPQLLEGDEVIVVGDLRDGPLPEVEAEVEQWDQCWYLPLLESATCDWGHSNLNAAMRRASGDWLTWTDDDDVYTPGALAAIRRNAAKLDSPAPLIFRYRSPVGYVVPPCAGKEVQGHISGQCLVVPNVPDRFGTWSKRYEGDFDMIRSTITAWAAAGVAARWRPEIIGAGRPQDPGRGSTPPVEWPASLESTALYRFLHGASPASVPRPLDFRLRCSFALLSVLLERKNRQWCQHHRLLPFLVDAPHLVEQLQILVRLCEEHAASDRRRAHGEEPGLELPVDGDSDSEGSRAWLYRDAAYAIVGFSMLQRDSDQRLKLSMGVLPQFRERGHDASIAAHIAGELGESAFAAVRTDDSLAC